MTNHNEGRHAVAAGIAVWASILLFVLVEVLLLLLVADRYIR